METISVNGETFVKGNILARELGYTSDYVGQLCRSGKVTAELVGRSWYVEPSSLKAHKRSRYRSVAKKSEEQIKREVSRRKEIEQVANRPSFYSKIHHPDVRYYQDEDDLFPLFESREGEEKASTAETISEYVENHTDSEEVTDWPVDSEDDALSEQEDMDIDSNLEVQKETVAVPVSSRTLESNRPARRKQNLSGRLDIVSVDQEESVLISRRERNKSSVRSPKVSQKGSDGLKKAINISILLALLVVAGGLTLTESRISTGDSNHEAYVVNLDNYRLIIASIRDVF